MIAIGDGIVDINMLDKAGLGQAFNSSEKVQKHANIFEQNFEYLKLIY